MKTYQLECAEINYFVIEVEAQSEDEAINLARENINSFEVLDEYVIGQKIAKIAKSLGMSKSTVQRFCIASGI